MIKNPRFLFSTFLMILFLAICYVFGISWSAITYQDWLTSEVSRGIYFYRVNWETLFSVIFLIYWSINIDIPIQTIVRLKIGSLLARMYMVKTLKLAFIYAFIYWLLPWIRILQFNPSRKEVLAFCFLWSLQVLLSISWALMIIFFLQIILNYVHWSPITLGLAINVVIDVILFLPMIDSSVFAQIQVTSFVVSGALNAGISYALFVFTLYLIILFALYVLFQNSIRRREWIK